ncbi:MAG: RNA polymerase sigma factor [Alphaproteobacteria bacterium]|nr:RNA polymerase sigma factor [Alphaproteobacteria bacterium]
MTTSAPCVQQALGKRPATMHKGEGRVALMGRRVPVGTFFGGRPLSTRDPDEDLVRKIGAGDKRAASEIVRRHLPKMVGLGRRMLGDAAEAEDVAQEVFLRVWKHAASWKPGQAKFETWMHRVAMNLCLDRLRRSARNGGEVSPETPDGTASATRPLDDLQRKERVRAALQVLPERQRAALVLCYYQERTNIEAAEILGVSVDALESLLARARRALKAALSAERADLMSGLETG